MVRVLSFLVLVFLARIAYIITVRGKSCVSGDFCFFPETLIFATGDYSQSDTSGDAENTRLRNYYYAVFEDLIAEGYLSPDSKCICIDTLSGQDVVALRDIGVTESIGISKKSSPPLVLYGQSFRQPFDENSFDFEFSGDGPFDENSFDFEFSGDGVLDRSSKPVDFASEVSRTLRPGGFFVVHTTAKDLYSLNSLLDLFNTYRLIRSRDIEGLDSSMPWIREIVLRKKNEVLRLDEMNQSLNVNPLNRCSVPVYKRELIQIAEPLIKEEPLKPWITLKRNIKNIQYLSSMADIRFKNRYIYVDVGARSYGSSIGSWFKKLYPKQNKSFEIFAIEADKAFHQEYRSKKWVTLLPYAAWVRNETLFFEINREPSRRNEEKGLGMGRIQAVQSSSNFVGDLDKIQGFDFANWLKSAVSNRDYVVVKMDVEGTEFQLIPRLVETGAMCLIDEMFLECHYNRWQRCCPGERSPKYHKMYAECLELFASLRESGVLVHQWW
ncbi:unnamed protein product [Ilex paraguariensis]|uniref:DUF7870 domain-containing protein n=1 Tax=Ilex paraguariensis TaxID=185542 RepID=A0ABC8T440_9AQUA